MSVRQENPPYNLGHFLAASSFDYASSPSIWPSFQTNPGADNVEGTAFSSGMLDHISPPSPSWNPSSDAFFVPQIHHFKDRVVLGSFFIISLSPSFVNLDTKTIIEKRDSRAGPHGSVLGRTYCISILRAYPEMMCCDNGPLPPFIHLQSRPPSLQLDSNSAERLPEPLAICSSIMRMYQARSPGNLNFIWRTIQVESTRIENEVSATLHSLQRLNHGLKDTVPILRSLDYTCLYPSHDHIPYSRSTRRQQRACRRREYVDTYAEHN